MRIRPLVLISSLRIAATVGYDYSPFSDPLFGLSEDALLVKRQGCEAGLNSCSGLGANNVCCPEDTTCTLDQAGHVACCSTGAVCSGTIAGLATGTITTSSTGIVLGGGTTSTP